MGEYVTEGEIRDVEISSLKPQRSVPRAIDNGIVKQLAESISNFGLIHPITISNDNVIIAGNHRVAAMKTLGKKIIRATVLPVSGVIARILMIEENLIRSELTTLEQSEYLDEHSKLLEELGQRATKSTGGKNKGRGAEEVRGCAPDHKTTKDIAEEMGMAERTLQERFQIANSLSKQVRDKLRNTSIADNKGELLYLTKLKTPEDQMNAVEKVLSGEAKTLKEAVSKISKERQRDAFATEATEVRKLPDTISLTFGDFFEMEDDPNFPKHNSVDAIITDPPYVEDWRENWAPFLGIAADILKPGGFLISYVGHIRLPEFFAALEETQIESPSKLSKNNKLEFFWICALEHKGAITAVHTRSVQCGFKPILIAFKPPARKPYQYLNDLLQGSGREKDLHEWQQGVSELIPLLDAFTKPGDIVLDPFMGSGTTAVACKMTARRFIGYDNVQENVDNATSRILQLDK